LGEHIFMDSELVFSGDTVTSEITIFDVEKLNGKIYTGLDFDFYEGEIKYCLIKSQSNLSKNISLFFSSNKPLKFKFHYFLSSSITVNIN
jgi:hypothetical protein